MLLVVQLDLMANVTKQPRSKIQPPHEPTYAVVASLEGLQLTAITQDVEDLLSVALESPRGGSLEGKSQLLLPMKKV